MADQPIPASTAQQMMNAYKQYMTDHGVNMNQQTQSVSFNSATVLAWLNQVAPLMDELRIFNGLYESGPSAGRTTVILWPYKKGQPAVYPQAQASSSSEGEGEGEGEKYVDPFNEGSGNP